MPAHQIHVPFRWSAIQRVGLPMSEASSSRLTSVICSHRGVLSLQGNAKVCECVAPSRRSGFASGYVSRRRGARRASSSSATSTAWTIFPHSHSLIHFNCCTCVQDEAVAAFVGKYTGRYFACFAYYCSDCGVREGLSNYRTLHNTPA